jgi:hypothetical protein
MKKTLIFSSLFILMSSILNAQNIALTFDNATITNNGTNSFYETDVIIVRTSATNFKLGTGQFYIDYNPAAFGMSIGNATVDFEYSIGSILAETNISAVYESPIVNSNSNGTVSISWEQGLSAGSMAADNITETPTLLGHLKIQMINVAQMADICFNVTGPAFDDQFFTACGPFTPGVTIADCIGMNAGIQILNYDGSNCTGSEINKVVVNPPTAIEICDETPNDGIGIFDLTIRESEMLGTQTGLTVTYHEIQSDATSGANPLVNPTSYTNTINPQIVYPRVTKLSNGDFATTVLTLIVLPAPTPASPTPLVACDNNNDGFTEFDLSLKTVEITNGEPDISISYHETLQDAIDGVNELASPYSNNIPFTQNIFVRAEGDLTGCSTTVELVLIVDNLPDVNSVLDYIIVDINNDGIETFDLTTRIPEILGAQNPADFQVTFYETITDAQFDVNEIMLPTAYVNTSNPQTIYVRITNSSMSCFSLNEFIIFAEPNLSIEDHIIPNIVLYPNPTREVLNLESQKQIKTVKIYSIQGQLIKSDSASVIDVSQLAEGLFFIQITIDNKIITKKFIKKKN